MRSRPHAAPPTSVPPRRRDLATGSSLALAVAVALAAPARAAEAPTAAPVGQVVLLSTSDVKAKTMPCGCHVPKGGLARRAGFADSLRAIYPDLLVVDTGGFFPDGEAVRDDAPFVAQAMHDMGVAAAGVSDEELMFGRAYFLATLREHPVPVVCANLWERSPHRTLVQPWIVQQAGRYKVGLFGLIAPIAELGPSSDSLEVSDPTEAARGAVAALRKAGADVIVALSSLGKMPTEDLALAVPGIDVAVAGRNVPLLQRSRQLDQTTVVYGGEQGQFAVVTRLGLDGRGAIVSRDSEAWMLGPAVRDDPTMQARVAAFEARPEVAARRTRVKPANPDTTKTSAR